MEMYVWKVKLEVQYESKWKENGKVKTSTWEDGLEYTIAASSGRDAITKGEKVFLSEAPWEGEHCMDDDSIVPTTERPTKILDVVGLELLETLDG